MVWVFLEILAAAAVGALLVWWTLPRRKPEQGDGDDGGRSS
ncbi:MAG TPA: hypothetical protein VFM11_03895 [Burkholderiales bacterium]|jgi:hypothetical protein|nr:hypothetical protein [Burkholderiales bacterium]